MYKHKLFLLPLALLLAFMALACAPPDDDDRSSGPAITSASYDFATALLTVQGTDLSPTEAQIQTITVAGLALSSYTADDPATGSDSSDLAKGKYRIKSDGTELWLKLTEQHKAVLEAKVGSDGLKKGLLTSSGAWAGLDTAKDLTVRNIPAAEQVDDQSRKQTEDEEAEEESPKQPKDKQVEQAEEESPKQPKDKQVEQAEEESRKLPEAEQTEEVDDESPKQPKDKQVEQAEEESRKLPEAEQTEEVDDESPKQPKAEQVEQAEEESPKQPKAEQVEQVEEDSPEAAITGASYNVGTALLTVQGSNLSPTEAQIQTITVGSRTNGVALDSYTADTTATGADSHSLAKGKYRIKSDGTAIWLYLTDRHKTTLNGKPGMDSNGLKDGLLTSTGTWAGLDTAKALAVSGNPPAITSATYHVGTALLTVQGSNLSPTTATQAQIQTITVDGIALDSYTADGTATGPDSRSLAKGKYRIKSDGTKIWLYLTDQHKTTLNGKDGMDTNGLKDGLLTSTGAWAGLDTAKALTVSGNPPTITRATYNANTGVLVITGVNLPTAVARWDFTKLRFVAGNGDKSAPLFRHSVYGTISFAKGSAASSTSLTILLKGSEKWKAEKILFKNGDSDDNGAYNLEAAAGFAGGSAEDTSNNPITVSGYISKINSVLYSTIEGILLIEGANLPRTVAEWDFSKLTIVSGDGNKRYTLPQHATAGENTATGSMGVNRRRLFITLSGSVRAEAEKILVKVGKSDNNGAYNLEVAAGFVMGGLAYPTNAIKVVNY